MTGSSRFERSAWETQDIAFDVTVHAFAHSTRLRILELLAERDLSPGLLAERLDRSVPYVRYHLGILADAELVELVRTTVESSDVDCFFRARASSTWPSQYLDMQSPTLSAAIVEPMGVQELSSDTLAAVQAAEVLNSARLQLRWVGEQSNSRLAVSGDEGVKLLAGVFLIPMPQSTTPQ